MVCEVMMRKNNLRIAGFVLGVLLIPLLFGARVFAATDASTLMKKTLANGIFRCYDSKYMKSNVLPASVEGVRSVMENAGFKDGTVVVPYMIGNTLKDSDISCFELFVGYDDVGGRVKGLLNGNDNLKGNALLDKLGYPIAEDNKSSICLSYEYYLGAGGGGAKVYLTNKLCFKVNEGCAGDDDCVVVRTSGRSVEGRNGPFLINVSDDSSVILHSEDFLYADGKPLFKIKNNMTVSEFKAAADNSLNIFNGVTFGSENTGSTAKSCSVEYDNVHTHRIITDSGWDSVRLKALENLTGYKNQEEAAFNKQDQYDLYMSYLVGSSSVYNLYKTDKCFDKKVDSTEKSVPFVGGGDVKWCELGGDFSNGTKVSIFVGNNYYLTKGHDVNDVIQAVRSLIEDDSDPGIDLAEVDADGTISQTVDDDKRETDACYENAASMGWWICPVMSKISEALDHLYDNISDQFLVINTQLLSNEGGTWDGWSAMVGIANTMMVIYLLVVIFSQLTGVGIDNYGIKKSLPKIILAAVLINFSYIVCQLAVDVSNIVGSSLEGFLSGIKVGGLPDELTLSGDPTKISSTANNAEWFKSLFTITSGGLIGIGGYSITASILAEGFVAGLVIPFLLLIVTALVAVLFFFILLGVRKGGVVVLVILAPLAMACYMLPNTKKWFDKWLNAFKGLLLVYPICGLLIGGGQLVSKIVLTVSDDYMMYFTGCVILVVPYFLMPSILRGSFAVMGNIGERISNFGRNLGNRGRSRLDNAVKSRPWYKEGVRNQQMNQQFNQERLAARRAQRIHDSLDGRTNLSERQRRRLALANQTLLENEKRQRQDEINANSSYYNAALAKQELELDNSAADLELYGNEDYVKGKSTQAKLSRENENEGALLYTRSGFEESKRRQYGANRQREIRNMYGEQYENMDKGKRQAELVNALNGEGADAAERMDAAFASLMKTGDVSEVLDAFKGANFSTMSEDLRNRAVALAAASGNQLLKGWAKACSNVSGGLGLENYITGTGTNSLQNYLKNEAGVHAFDNADKDTLRFLADNGGANAMSDEMIASMATTAANTNQNAAAAVVEMISGREAGVGHAISAEALTRMSGTIANAIGKNNLNGAIDEINRPGNEALKARLNRDVRDMTEGPIIIV